MPRQIQLNIVDKKSPVIVFCLPGNQFSGRFLDSLLNLTYYCNQAKIKYYISRKESSVIYYVRNMCLGGNVLRGENQKPFDGKLDYTHMLWIDSDVIFTVEHFKALLRHDKDIVSGIYMMGNKTHFTTVETWNEEYFKQHGTFQFLTETDLKDKTNLFESDYTGFGFMLVKCGVFESLIYPWFEPIFYQFGDVKDFCSEDVSFCKKIKEKGFKLWVDPAVRVGHEKMIVL